jgi:hypothetical protein
MNDACDVGFGRIRRWRSLFVCQLVGSDGQKKDELSKKSFERQQKEFWHFVFSDF